jgi:Na+/H+-dicarboxylate symporter/ABC-type amino acid transport substrate-binding protein
MMSEEKNTKPRLSLSTMILIGLGLGIACGFFFGEYCGFLSIIGDAFIQLLQMTILPYIVASLILGIGGLSYKQAKLLALRGGIIMLLFWVISFTVILLLPLSFPKWETASFFSTSLVSPPKEVDFLKLYIPSNPFWSLANNVVPAVVLFSILAGIALIGIKEKDSLVQGLMAVSGALIRMTNIVVKLTPIGVFAIAASAAGTMTVEEFGKLQVYLVSYNLAAILLTFAVLPLLLKPVTPFKYKDIVGLSKDALVTAFTTGNLFIVLTVLTENCKSLFKKYNLTHEKTEAYVDVLVPISFNFPNTGKLIMLLFVLFGAWFTGTSFSFSQYGTFVSAGLLSFFGGVDVALPFMLDLMHLPKDLYQLYLVTGVINGRTATLLAAMNLLVFTLLTTSALTGTLSFNKKKLINTLSLIIVIIFSSIGVTRLYFDLAVTNEYTKDRILSRMHVKNNPLPQVVYKEVPAKLKTGSGGIADIGKILKRGKLRVGYNPDSLPFSFFNAADELVGFDVEMAYMLANELNVDAEFVPFQYDTLADQLNRGEFDIAMSGISMSTSRIETVNFSDPYLELTVALIVRDYRRDEFSSLESIRKIGRLTVTIEKDESYVQKIEELLPGVEVIQLDSNREFFERNVGNWDALITNAESGSAWTLLYPQYTVVIPKPNISTFPLGYAVAKGNQDLLNFLNNWIQIKKKSPQVKAVYDLWILGRGAVPKKPRWSVIRNVLKWVK